LRNVKAKNILIFFPNGRGNYGSAVAAELEKKGANVYMYDERPDSSVITKVSIRLAKDSLRHLFLHYVKKILKDNNTVSFDIILIVRGEAFTPLVMRYLRKTCPAAHFILYLWDSVKNTNTTSIFPYFDKVLSFDTYDVEKFKLIHRPLFFIDDYREISRSVEREIDVLFIGKIHSDRYHFIKMVETELKMNDFKTYFYFYIQSRLLFYMMRLQEPTFRNAKLDEFKFTILPSKDVSKIMKLSRASLDAQHPNQTGLTMRTVEVLGARRKLITTNQDIKNYDFFRSENIQVVDRKNPIIDFDFIRTPYSDVPDLIYERYSLQGWLGEIMEA